MARPRPRRNGAKEIDTMSAVDASCAEKRGLIWPVVVALSATSVFALLVFPLSTEVAGGEQAAASVGGCPGARRARLCGRPRDRGGQRAGGCRNSASSTATSCRPTRASRGASRSGAWRSSRRSRTFASSAGRSSTAAARQQPGQVHLRCRLSGDYPDVRQFIYVSRPRRSSSCSRTSQLSERRREAGLDGEARDRDVFTGPGQWRLTSVRRTPSSTPWLLMALGVAVACARLVDHRESRPRRATVRLIRGWRPRPGAVQPGASDLNVRLDDLKHPGRRSRAGGRNPFRFYTPPPPAAPMQRQGRRPHRCRSRRDRRSPRPAAAAADPVKFFGVLEGPGAGQDRGTSATAATTMRGREGEIIGGQYRIVQIGVESVVMEYPRRTRPDDDPHVWPGMRRQVEAHRAGLSSMECRC